MLWTINALPWEWLAEPLAMIVLTYPVDWRGLCPSGEVAKNRHLKRFKARWSRKFGSARGMWVMEFQERGAPHFHLYMACPVDVFGSKDAFEEWVREAWWRCVGSGDPFHRKYGAHFSWCSVSPDATPEERRRETRKLVEYFLRESGKEHQKSAPDDFGSVGRYWGYWGMKPVVHEIELSPREYVEARRPAVKMRDVRVGRRVARPKGMDGCLVMSGDGIGNAIRLRSWAQREAAAHDAWVAGERSEPARNYTPGRRRRRVREWEVVEVDPETGEIWCDWRWVTRDQPR